MTDITSTTPTTAQALPADLPHYYVDQVRAFTGPWDITMMMGNIRPIGIGENDGAIAVPLFSVSMSHVHAKRFAEVLLSILKRHEEEYGPIQSHEPIKAQLKDGKKR